MGLLQHTIDDGDGRYGSRTRVNRLVYEFLAADLNGQTSISATVPMNGEVHTIWLDVSGSKLATNTNTQTTHGSFALSCGDYDSVSGLSLTYHNPILNLDFTSMGNPLYKFQTCEGAAMSAAAPMEHSLSISPGLSAHSGAPATPTVADAAGAATPIASNQAWTGRVAGNVRITLASTTAWAADTGNIRITILYSQTRLRRKTDTGEMSDMALTVTQVGRNTVAGNRISAFFSAVTDDSTWNAGGESFDATSYIKNPDQVTIESTGGYVFEYDRANKKIKAYADTNPADGGGANIPLIEATGLDLRTLTLRIGIVGTRA